MLLEEPLDPDAGASLASPLSAPDQRYLTRGEAASYLGVPVSTIYQWARTGRLACVVTLGGHLRFSTRDLDVAAAPRPRAPRRSRLQPPASDS